jgi:hypothetical protein
VGQMLPRRGPPSVPPGSTSPPSPQAEDSPE